MDFLSLSRAKGKVPDMLERVLGAHRPGRLCFLVKYGMERAGVK